MNEVTGATAVPLHHRDPPVGNTEAVEDYLIPTGYERTLPPGVQLSVRQRRRTLARAARGRVLDLGGAESHAGLWGERHDLGEVVLLDGADDPQLASLARGDHFDTVFSVFQLATAPDLAATVRRVRDVLAPDGHLFFIEPARRPGMTGRLQRAMAPALALTSGWRIDRDIPVALREGGLSVVDIDRFTMPTTALWMRVGVEGRAHHAVTAHRPDPS